MRNAASSSCSGASSACLRSPEHPLALFLDDLQWLDAATLDLIEDLMTQPDVRHLLLIGAYRDNEVGALHPLQRKLVAIRQAQAAVQEISLGPLAGDDVGQLMADALRCERAHAMPLAQLVHEKTGGNPFFVIQFLSALVENGPLFYDHVSGRWSWDPERIHAQGYTDNVVELVVGRLARLGAPTQEALRQLACLGSNAELTRLSLILGTSEDELHAQLADAVAAELVERQDSAYRFIHDRVREAAYSLIPEDARAAAHLRIGRLLAAHTPEDKREESIFEIVGQLNRGAELITSTRRTGTAGRAQPACRQACQGVRGVCLGAQISSCRRGPVGERTHGSAGMSSASLSS